MQTEIVKQDSQPPTIRKDESTIVDVIARCAADPSVDVEKMQRLLDMQLQIAAREAEKEFNAAMTAAQSEMGRISADATNPQTRSKYASYAQLDRHLRPIYTKHGFSISFNEATSDKPDTSLVVAIVAHSSGHSRTYQKLMPADGKGAKGGDVMTKTHAAGSAMSYGMRYLLKGIFNVAVGEDDDDGNSATANKRTAAKSEPNPAKKDAMRKLWALLKPVRGTESSWDTAEAWLCDNRIMADTETVRELSVERIAEVYDKASIVLAEQQP